MKQVKYREAEQQESFVCKKRYLARIFIDYEKHYQLVIMRKDGIGLIFIGNFFKK